MDTLPILSAAGTATSAAKTAWDVGTAVYLFFEGTNSVDETLRAFAEEVKALGSACEVIGKRLEDIHRDLRVAGAPSPIDRSDKLWLCLQDQLAACQRTILGLQDAVRMPNTLKPSGYLERVRQQLVLVLRANDIAEVRNRIRSHTTSLQILLQGLTIEIVYLAPYRADQELHNKLEELAKKNDELTRLVRERQFPPFAGDPDPARLLHTSTQILSSGETLYATSVAEGSVTGAPSPANSNIISNWLQRMNAIDGVGLETDTTADTDTTSIWTDNVAATEETLSVVDPQTSQSHERHARAVDHSSAVPVEEIEGQYDSDDEFLLEAIRQAIDAGEENFQKDDWDTTYKMLQEAQVMIRELPTALQNRCTTNDMRYMLSICAFHLQDPTTAKAALSSFIDHTSSAPAQNDTQRLHICDAYHHLAQAYVKLGEYGQARTYCDSALQGRRRLLGKRHQATYESLALMVRILELEGKIERATIMAKMIPDEHKGAIVHYRGLSTSQPSPTDLAGPSSSRAIAPVGTAQPLAASVLDTASNAALSQSTEKLSLSDATTADKKKQVPGFRNTHLLDWVYEHGYQKPMPMPRDKAVRKHWSKKFHFAIKTKLLKALADGEDDEALVLSQGGSGRWFDRHYEAGGPPELHVAALYGQVETVERLLQIGADVRYKSRWGLQPLHCAAAAGYANIARMLIAAGAPINDSSDFVGTPLCLAVLRQRLDVVDLLLHHNADPLAAGGKLGSPIHLACATDNVALVQALNANPHGFNEPRTIDISMFWNVLRDPSTSDDSHHRDQLPILDGTGYHRLGAVTGLPLEFAAFHGANTVVTHLLTREVYLPTTCTISPHDNLQKSFRGHTALSLATLGAHPAVVRTLLRHVPPATYLTRPADVDERVHPLYCAAISRCGLAVEMLLAAGARATERLVRDVALLQARSPRPRTVHAEEIWRALERSVEPGTAATAESRNASRAPVVAGPAPMTGRSRGSLVSLVPSVSSGTAIAVVGAAEGGNSDPPPEYREVEGRK